MTFVLLAVFGSLLGFFIVGHLPSEESEKFDLAPTAEPSGSLYRIAGNSMAPLLHSGESVWIKNGSHAVSEIKRGDIVAIQPFKRKTPLIKRIVAISGDRFHVDGDRGFFFVNDNVVLNSVSQPYHFDIKKRHTLQRYEATFKGLIPNDSFLVFGDQVAGTLDSTVFGLVGIDEIIGVVEQPAILRK